MEAFEGGAHPVTPAAPGNMPHANVAGKRDLVVSKDKKEGAKVNRRRRSARVLESSLSDTATAGSSPPHNNSTGNAVVVSCSASDKDMPMSKSSLVLTSHKIAPKSGTATSPEIPGLAAPPNTPVKDVGLDGNASTIAISDPFHASSSPSGRRADLRMLLDAIALEGSKTEGTTFESKSSHKTHVEIDESGSVPEEGTQTTSKRNQSRSDGVEVLGRFTLEDDRCLIVVMGNSLPIEQRLEGYGVKEANIKLHFAAIVHKLVSEVHREDPSILRWEFNGKAFHADVTHPDMPKILKLYFNHEKFASFQRQLNTYGWQKCRAGTRYAGHFYHPLFHRDISSQLDFERISRGGKPSARESHECLSSSLAKADTAHRPRRSKRSRTKRKDSIYEGMSTLFAKDGSTKELKTSASHHASTSTGAGTLHRRVLPIAGCVRKYRAPQQPTGKQSTGKSLETLHVLRDCYPSPSGTMFDIISLKDHPRHVAGSQDPLMNARNTVFTRPMVPNQSKEACTSAIEQYSLSPPPVMHAMRPHVFRTHDVPNGAPFEGHGFTEMSTPKWTKESFLGELPLSGENLYEFFHHSMDWDTVQADEHLPFASASSDDQRVGWQTRYPTPGFISRFDHHDPWLTSACAPPNVLAPKHGATVRARYKCNRTMFSPLVSRLELQSNHEANALKRANRLSQTNTPSSSNAKHKIGGRSTMNVERVEVPASHDHPDVALPQSFESNRWKVSLLHDLQVCNDQTTQDELGCVKAEI